MSPLFNAAVTPLIRAIALIATGWLVSHGIWSESLAGKVVEAAVSGGAIYAWAMVEKWRARVLLHTALAMPAGSTVQEAKVLVKEGMGPPASVPENVAPFLPVPKP